MFLERDMFRMMMGFQETGSSVMILNKIFDSISLRKQGVTFTELVTYLDVLQHGSQEEKIRLCFNMIDTKKKGLLSLDDFKSLLTSAMLTNNNRGRKQEIEGKASTMAIVLFQKFGKKSEEDVSLEEFLDSCNKDPSLLEIFTLLNRGITETIIAPNTQDNKLFFYLNHAKFIVTSLKSIIKELENPTPHRYSKKENLAASTMVMTVHRNGFETDAKYKSDFDQHYNRINGDGKYKSSNSLTNQVELISSKLMHKNNIINEEEDLLQEEVAQKVEDFIQKEKDSRENKKARLINPFTLMRPRENSQNILKRDSTENNNLSKSQHLFQTPVFIENDFSFANGKIGLKANSKENLVDRMQNVERDIVMMEIPEENSIMSLRNEKIREHLMPRSLNFVKLNAALEDLSEKISIQDKLISPENNAGFNLKDPLIDVEEVNQSSPFSKSPHKIRSESVMRVHNISSGMVTPNPNSKGQINIPPIFRVDSERISHGLRDPINTGRDTHLTLKRKLTEILDLWDDVVKVLSHEQEDKVARNSLADKKKKMMKATLNIPTSKSKTAADSNSLIFIFHKDWNLVINIMIGINKAIRALWDVDDHTISNQDYKMRDRFELTFNRGIEEDFTSKQTISFFSYSPYIFADIRKIYKISNQSYMDSIGSDSLISNLVRGELAAFRELFSSGKSGSFFYYSIDGKYVLKTLKKVEYQFMKKILKDYHLHLKSNPKSLLPKFFGLHKILYRSTSICKKTTNIYLCIMDNVFGTDRSIHERFDLKGSTYKRTVGSAHLHDNLKAKIALKDNDFISLKRSVNCPIEIAKELNLTIAKDCEFFVRNAIIDYSLLIGIHEVSAASPMLHEEPEEIQEDNSYFMRVNSQDGRHVYFFGIIDILTTYNSCFKKFEHQIKKVFQGPTISCVPPRPYSERFKTFIKTTIFVEKETVELRERAEVPLIPDRSLDMADNDIEKEKGIIFEGNQNNDRVL